MTINALARGETIELNGSYFKMDGNGQVEVGDSYIAERNTGPELLQAEEVHADGWIRPTTMRYSYDIWECTKVIRVPAPSKG